MTRATGPVQQVRDLSAGGFRTLEWPGRDGPPVVFLHGLSGVAEVWEDTIAALGPDRPRCIALDQRGHGDSPWTPGAYRAVDFLRDLVELVELLGAPVDLVGHSMGARIAILAAARHPELLRSVVIVDIGPEAWTANIAGTAAIFSSLPRSFADRATALSLGRLAGKGDAWAERMIDRRLRPEPDGSYTWRGSIDGWVEMVTVQRARSYWSDWDRISIPALLVRGGTSDELRPRIVERMRRRNPSVSFVEFDDVGHNIPLLAPDRLATELTRFRAAVDGPGR